MGQLMPLLIVVGALVLVLGLFTALAGHPPTGYGGRRPARGDGSL
ncbi:hypothetical protein ACFXKY_01375 [Streptomyces canus]